MNTFEIYDSADARIIRWGNAAEIKFAPKARAGWQWLKRPRNDAQAIACGRQAGVFQHRAAGREVLHGSAVRLPEGVLCVCGERGMGKSTLAVALNRRGLPILTDDDIILCKEAGTQRLSPNYSGSRLTEESAKLLCLNERELSAEFPGSDKWIWRGPSGNAACVEGTYVIWGFVILEAGDEARTSFERINNTAAFEALWSQIKFPWMNRPGWRLRQFRVIANLASRCAVFRWRRNVEGATPNAAADDLLNLLSAAR